MNMSNMNGKTAIATLMLASVFALCAPVSHADGGYYDQVYTPRLAPRIKPIAQPDYYAQPAPSTSYAQPSYDEQPTLYGYDRREPQPQPQQYQHRTISEKIEDGFRDLWHSPTVKKSIVGAGTGVGVAALAEKNLLKGGLVGAGVGLGVSAMDDSYYFKRHPLVRRTSQGAAIGVGAAAITSTIALWPAAALGAGIGAGIHYVKTH